MYGCVAYADACDTDTDNESEHRVKNQQPGQPDQPDQARDQAWDQQNAEVAFRMPRYLIEALAQRRRFAGVSTGDLIAYALYRLWQVEGDSQDWPPEQLAAWAGEVRAWATDQEALRTWVQGWRPTRHGGRLGPHPSPSVRLPTPHERADR